MDTYKIDLSNVRFNYMLLGRLQSDCYGYLEYGRSLWGGDAKTHIDTMWEIYNCLKVKPLWLTRSELEELSCKLMAKSA